jgi:hypothetical protein
MSILCFAVLGFFFLSKESQNELEPKFSIGRSGKKGFGASKS